MLRPEPEGGFTAIVPALPGCVTYGRTLAEARTMAKDAISGYIESLKKHKEPIPTDDETLVASLDLEYSH
jgi:antitoxin HicB